MRLILCSSFVLVALASCSSGNNGTGVAPDGGGAGGDGGNGGEAGAPGDSGVPDQAAPNDAGADAPTGGDLNPYGVAYPTDHLGTNARAGATRGNRIANVSLQGYAPGSTTLGKVSFANLYDPQGKTHDVVIVVAGALWDSFTPKTLDAIKGSPKRIATLAVLGEGTSPGVPATLANLSSFRALYPWATTALDAGSAVFGVFFDAAAVLLVMFIDARTMEIAQSGVGGITTTQEIDAAVVAVTSRPAAY